MHKYTQTETEKRKESMARNQYYTGRKRDDELVLFGKVIQENLTQLEEGIISNSMTQKFTIFS